jgi:peroxiredoxin
MALQTELAAQHAWRDAHFPPDLRQALDLSIASLKRAGWANKALQVGDTFPALELLDSAGANFSLSRILGRSPLIVSFFCGHWSPYCNLELRAFNTMLPQIQALGARFVPIVGQDVSLNFSTQRCNRLNYSLFSDPALQAARACGLVMPLPDVMTDVMEQLGIDLPGYQPGKSYELPMPANYLIDSQGKVVYAFADEDIRHRSEPETLLNALQVLQVVR